MRKGARSLLEESACQGKEAMMTLSKQWLHPRRSSLRSLNTSTLTSTTPCELWAVRTIGVALCAKLIPFSLVPGRSCRSNRVRSSFTRGAVRSNTNFSCEQQCCKKSRTILMPPVQRHAMRLPSSFLRPLGLRRFSLSLTGG